MHYKNFEELNRQVLARERPVKMAVVCANDVHSIDGAMLGFQKGIVEPILIGDQSKIEQILSKHHFTKKPQIIHAEDREAALKAFVKLNRETELGAVMKGLIETPVLMKTILDKENGLRTGRLMSHFALFEIPGYHKLMGITDIALAIEPTLEQKISIIHNAVQYMSRLGISPVKTAVLTAFEKVNPKMQDTVDAAKLAEMGANGEFPNAIVEGPISYDIMWSKEAADVKQVDSKISGDTDLLIMPNLTSGNILAKALGLTMGAKSAGIVLGAKVPIVMVSRSSDEDVKLQSIIMACAAAAKTEGEERDDS